MKIQISEIPPVEIFAPDGERLLATRDLHVMYQMVHDSRQVDEVNWPTILADLLGKDVGHSISPSSAWMIGVWVMDQVNTLQKKTNPKAQLPSSTE